MNKYLLLSAIAILFITCKKGHQITPKTTSPVVTGTWTLYSWNESVIGPLNVNSDEYPCISNNVTIFNQDSTVTGSYIGKDSCYVTPLHGFVNGATTIGIPGQQAISGAWHQNGNVVYFASGYSIISNINGKLLLTRKDSIFYGGKWGMITTVNIKQ